MVQRLVLPKLPSLIRLHFQFSELSHRQLPRTPPPTTASNSGDCSSHDSRQLRRLLPPCTYASITLFIKKFRDYKGDPMRLLFSKSASPHHGFAAYYSYVEKIFKADAVLHFGTHGSLEFMPWKQVGISDACFPDSLISNIPNVYYYAANNPSEATIVKRRSYANTISYLTPPPPAEMGI